MGLIIGSDQQFANTAVFEENMGQLAKNVSSIIYDSQKHTPRYPETFFCVGSMCNSQATHELADQRQSIISTKLEGTIHIDRVKCRLGQWVNWVFSTDLPSTLEE